MNTPAEFNPQPYLIQVDPASTPENLICGDDRPNTEGIVGWQIFGGPDGLGRDVAVALEMQKPGSFIEQGIPKHHLGSMLNKYLGKGGTLSFMHHGCASFLLAQEVRSSITDNLEDVHAQTAAFGFEITEEEAERTEEASWRLRQSGLLVPPTDIHDELLDGRDDSPIEPVPHLHLVDSDHVANDITVDYTGEVMWDTQKAFDEDSASYFVGFGTLEHEAERIRTIFPVDKRALMVAAVMRASAISLKLPRPEGRPLDIHTIGESQAA